jgi:4-amino-4-deoxy-L-arabinose transferase-like glycosyltransferase
MKRGWLLLILVLALAVRLFRIEERVVWFDEAVSLLVAKAAVPDIIAAATDDTHPPFYNLALHLCPRGELAARGFSVVCGVLTVMLVFLIGRKLGGVTAGAVSGALMALSPLHVWYSQEIRMYALQTLLVTASWWLLFLALERRRFWIGYVLVAALSLYAQYTSLFALAAQWLYVLCLRRDAIRPWLLAQAGVALLFAPCVPLFVHHLMGGTFGFWLGEFSWSDPVRFFALLSGVIPKNPGPYWPWVVLSVGVLIVATIRQGKKAVPLLLWLLVPVVLLVLTSLRANAFLPRALVMVTPAFALLVGCSAATRTGAVAAFLLAGANVVALQHYYCTKSPWVRSPLREVSTMLVSEMRTGDVVVHSSRFSYRPFQFYLAGKIPQGMVRPANEETSLCRVIGEGRLPVGEVRRVWLVLWPDFQQPDFHNQVLAYMNAYYAQRQEKYASSQLLVMLYETGK